MTPGELLAAGNDDVHHFAMGIWLLFLSYVVSVVGSIVGLACTRRSEAAAAEGERLRWLAMAAVAIGGVGIWLMHFIAMLGFSVPGSAVRYSVSWTIASAVLSILATFIGLVIVGRKVDVKRLVVGGVIMGLAVNLMHYTGMWAVRIQGEVSYQPMLVALSIVIAVVAGTAALWFTLVLESIWMRFAGGLIMGVAVVGMHFTGMGAVQVTLNTSLPVPAGLDVFSFLFPVFVIGLLALAIPITAVMMTENDDALSLSDAALLEPGAVPVLPDDEQAASTVPARN